MRLLENKTVFLLLFSATSFCKGIYLTSSPKQIRPARYNDFRLIKDFSGVDFIIKPANEVKRIEGVVTFIRDIEKNAYKMYIGGLPVCISIIDTIQPCIGEENEISRWKIDKKNGDFSICTPVRNGSNSNNDQYYCLSITKNPYENPNSNRYISIGTSINNMGDSDQLFSINDLI
ncbi:hypothetical protein EDEG_03669 [Edhazardia aedis USNM 41457]|uniref:Uncharacterized protein n=1 Tax=Edhazardia aedis (strain USNM 41457) TaxID=1003232 RepID=J9DKE7_EDHAE|nr:hypothetical protein EDEG_03669 [Edhazardia aedis USNM 41457]|eukprot:EJW01857.1 hypothetical protein EDEG_03669 [Edhazardia aedis USNM 41457]